MSPPDGGAGPDSRPNVLAPVWDAEADRPPYRWRRMRVGRHAGCEQLGASLFDVEPGSSTFPLHVHHANEELIVVLSGSLVLRTPDGERTLRPGDVAACLAGPRGAHRLRNDTDERARVLIVSTMRGPDVTEFPDSGLLWARTFAPGGAPDEDDREFSGEPSGLDPLALP